MLPQVYAADCKLAQVGNCIDRLLASAKLEGMVKQLLESTGKMVKEAFAVCVCVCVCVCAKHVCIRMYVVCACILKSKAIEAYYNMYQSKKMPDGSDGLSCNISCCCHGCSCSCSCMLLSWL